VFVSSSSKHLLFLECKRKINSFHWWSNDQ